ncbi:DNA processing protein DprA [Clostridium polyendosporum]|uniref:DNA processing protein DprA n=1 Tax=Clostridium polyendosporum TaxID=69208 RepID=A0A919RWY7_9CLOT|nr:DNA-processing protein DprA [Clostridium polyendosporum]GIM27819.1 DNA processing protein DprA [Clostridium polyendosporum]
METYKVWFSMLNITDNLKHHLIKLYNNEENICINYNEVVKYCLYNGVKKNIIKPFDEKVLLEYFNKLKSNNINITTINDEDYPQSLRKIEMPPYALFYKGNIKQLNEGRNIAIVGSRHCTGYGLQATNLISNSLSKLGVNIISGGAYGVDTEAHKSAVSSNGFTCAVLGCGIDIVYPAYNKLLYKKITDTGCIISEFALGVKPLPYNFPRRNRIISGLCDAVIVIEAGEKSGSLITANYALDQGKDVIAVPGSIFSAQSKGTNKLIRDGAFVFTDIKELYELLKIKELNKKLTSNTLKSQILKLLKDKPVHIDEIIRNTNIDTSLIYELLFEMQFKNEIICLLGNYYVKIN